MENPSGKSTYSYCSICGKDSEFAEKKEDYRKLLINNLMPSLVSLEMIHNIASKITNFCITCAGLLDDLYILKNNLELILKSIDEKEKKIKLSFANIGQNNENFISKDIRENLTNDFGVRVKVNKSYLMVSKIFSTDNINQNIIHRNEEKQQPLLHSERVEAPKYSTGKDNFENEIQEEKITSVKSEHWDPTFESDNGIANYSPDSIISSLGAVEADDGEIDHECTTSAVPPMMSVKEEQYEDTEDRTNTASPWNSVDSLENLVEIPSIYEESVLEQSPIKEESLDAETNCFIDDEEVDNDKYSCTAYGAEKETIGDYGKKRTQSRSFNRQACDNKMGQWFTCTYCGKEFRAHANLQRHELIHTGEKPFSCDVCSKKFSRADKLKCHQELHLRRDRSEHFTKKSNSSSDLNHLKGNHKGGKSFSCEICGESFSTAYTLQRHERGRHTGIKPFSCDVCGKTFNRTDHLKTHEATHLQGKPFSCSLCEKSFKRQDKLKIHERTHLKEGTGERLKRRLERVRMATSKSDKEQKVFQCKVCGKELKSMYILQRHELIHTGEKPFECDCGKKFSRVDKLKLHVKKMHRSKRSLIVPLKVEIP